MFSATWRDDLDDLRLAEAGAASPRRCRRPPPGRASRATSGAKASAAIGLGVGGMASAVAARSRPRRAGRGSGRDSCAPTGSSRSRSTSATASAMRSRVRASSAFAERAAQAEHGPPARPGCWPARRNRLGTRPERFLDGVEQRLRGCRAQCEVGDGEAGHGGFLFWVRAVFAPRPERCRLSPPRMIIGDV